MQGASLRFPYARRIAPSLVILLLAFTWLTSLASAATPAMTGLIGSGVLGNQFGLGGQRPESVEVSATFTAANADGPGRLYVTATMQPEWHIYSITQERKGPIPTTIKLDESDDYKVLGDFRPSPPPKTKIDEVAWPGLMIETHDHEVTWHVPIELASGVDPQSLKITGRVTAQACTDEACLPPANFDFTAKLGKAPIELDDKDLAAPAPANSEAGAATDAAALPSGAETLDIAKLKVSDDLLSMPVPLAMLFGFLGGLILNLMPCVLPVVGLKLLSFVEQSGHRREQVFLLNVWYTLGLMSVFMLLAALAAFVGLGWGQIYSYTAFVVALTGIVFVMALSFLGVWEIPIPGFVGGSTASNLAAKEGAGGAFAKGVITTILATPCSGPFLAPALVWAAAQPPLLTFSTFGCVGLGMASPYLIIGAFPQLIRFLPKPGAWMDTLKNVMGFVLLGTVVYLFTILPAYYVVPTIALLFGLWGACWWIGRTPFTAPAGAKARVWVEAIAFSALIAVVSFLWLDDVMLERFDASVDKRVAQRSQELQQVASETKGSSLPWRPFTPQTLQELTQSQYTVMVDFTADWCVTCKALEAAVLNTAKTREFLEARGIVPVQADWTRADKDVTEMLEALGSAQVPTLAIFPAGRPNEPIVLRGTYTPATLYEALEKAGPSKSIGESATAMRTP